MSVCPLDCAVPDIRREKLQTRDFFWLPLLLFPYRCRTCDSRFRRVPSSVGSFVVLTVLLLVFYLSSYAIGRRYDDHWIVGAVFWPIDWVVGQVRDAFDSMVVQK